MKKALVVLMAGLFISFAINVFGAVSIGDVTVTGTNTSGAVTISATISGASALGAMVTYQVTSTNGLTRRYFYPTQVNGTSWSSSEWIPYFVGTFIIELTSWDNNHSSPPVSASRTVTVERAVSGTVNSIKFSTAPYNATGTWTDVNTSIVKLHDIGLNADASGMSSIGCNLLNADPGDTSQMGEEQRDVAYTDTGSYKTNGTPYRFNVNLHARPRGFMGMGEIKRWIWAPVNTNVPDGPGRLTVDIASCSPWRSSYSNALTSHVGFAPLFAPSAGVLASPSDAMPTGMIMCTSAHYMDVGPTNAGTQAEMRCGLRVNGHTGTNSYVKTFLSDTFLQQQFGLTNALDATNIMAGFVQHLTTNGTPLDSVTQVTASFTRIAGGTNNILYDYNFDGIGDSGYEARLDFTFQSAVAAQIGVASTNVTQTYPVTGDIDGDAKADLISVVGANWYVWFSSSQYLTRCGPYTLNVSGTPTTGDIDGDRLADLISVVGSNWYIWFSSAQYLTRFGPYDLTTSGTPTTGDVDGDQLADLIVVAGSNWYIWFSSAQYLVRFGPYDLGTSGTPVTGDIDGDRLADLITVVGSNWYIWFSSSQYLVRCGPYDLGLSGTPATGDIDGDRLADLISIVGSNWYVWFSSSHYLVRCGPYTLSLP